MSSCLIELILPTRVQNLTTLGSAVPVIWLEPTKFCNASGDLTTPLPWTVCRLYAVTFTFNLYIKFVVFAIANYEDAPGNAKCRHRYSNLIETMRLSHTVFEILSLIFQKLKRSRDSDHAPFRDNLSSEVWDLLWSTCTPKFEVSSLSHSRDILRGLKV